MSARASSEPSDAFVINRVVEVRIVMKEEDWTASQLNAPLEQYVRADFWFDGELIPDVAVRPKGNSSLQAACRSGSPRLSLKVDFNLLNAARTFSGLKKLNFNNGFKDPTLIRERLAYELFDQMGIPTPRASHVDLWVNDTHLGVYTQVEQIDKTFLRQHFPKNDGNLYKPEMPAACLNWTEAELEERRPGMEATVQDGPGSSLDVNIGGGKLSEILEAFEQGESASYESGIAQPPRMPPPPGTPQGQQRPGQQRDYVEAVELKTNENCPDHSALFHFLNILNNESDETFLAEIEKVLDVDKTLRFLAVSTLIVHLDNYLGLGHNYYLYEVDGKFTLIPWDLNEAFGTLNCGIDREGIVNFLIDEPTAGPVSERPLVKRLLSHQPYVDKYHEYLQSLLDGRFDVNRMASHIAELASPIRPYVESDEMKFFSTEDFERNLSKDIVEVGIGGGKPNGGPPPNPPRLTPRSLSCLKKQLGKDILGELRTRKPTASELESLKSCLSTQELSAFVQGRYESTAPPPPHPPTETKPGSVILGLKTFVAEGSASVRQQLEGKRPSANDGSGNGGRI